MPRPSIFRMKMSSLTMLRCYAGKCWFAYLVGLDLTSSFFTHFLEKKTVYPCLSFWGLEDLARKEIAGSISYCLTYRQEGIKTRMIFTSQPVAEKDLIPQPWSLVRVSLFKDLSAYPRPHHSPWLYYRVAEDGLLGAVHT